MTLYHVSTKDLKIGDLLTVESCTNPFKGRKVVYATRTVHQSIIHVPISSFRDCGVQITDGETCFERAPGLFERAYNHQVYIYSVDDTGFERGPHGDWERVSFEDVVITDKRAVNAWEEIQLHQNQLTLHRYPERPHRHLGGLQDCDLLLKEISQLLKRNKPLSKLTSRFGNEIQLPHNELNDLIYQVANLQKKSDVFALLLTLDHSDASMYEWEQLMEVLRK